MSKQDELSRFIMEYEAGKSVYYSWGKYVCDYITEQLHLSPQEYQQLVKIPVVPRVKETDSMVEKAFYRKGKRYTDPLRQITDKVGIRFVVMVTNQIGMIEKVIKEAPVWTYSKDQDYQDAIDRKPDVFAYQSVHYVVKNKEEMVSDGITIGEGTACEIQIRTLEQHAYAELSHDYFYKNDEQVLSILRRYLARSMALNETADELFSKVYDMMNEEKQEYTDLMSMLRAEYPFEDYNEKLNKSIYDNISAMLKKYNIDRQKIRDFIQDYMISGLADRQDLILFRQPVILVIYYLVKYHRNELLEIWDQPGQQLELIYSDLGISFED